MNIKHQIRQSGFEGPAKRLSGAKMDRVETPIIARICTFANFLQSSSNQTPQLFVLHWSLTDMDQSVWRIQDPMVCGSKAWAFPPTSSSRQNQRLMILSNDCNGKFLLSSAPHGPFAPFADHVQTPLHSTGVLSIDRTETEEMCVYKLLDHTFIWTCFAVVFEGQVWESHKICLNMFRLNSFTNETLRRCSKGVMPYATLHLALGLVWELGCQFLYALQPDVAR